MGEEDFAVLTDEEVLQEMDRDTLQMIGDGKIDRNEAIRAWREDNGWDGWDA